MSGNVITMTDKVPVISMREVIYLDWPDNRNSICIVWVTIAYLLLDLASHMICYLIWVNKYIAMKFVTEIFTADPSLFHWFGWNICASSYHYQQNGCMKTQFWIGTNHAISYNHYISSDGHNNIIQLTLIRHYYDQSHMASVDVSHYH